jgi:hypothetical protein
VGIFSKFKTKVGEMVDKVKDKVEDIKEDKEESTRLRKFQDEFIKAKSQYDISLMDDREKLYIGTHAVDEDVNSNTTSVNGRKKANNVVNVIYELIESQIDTTIPSPSIRSKRQEKEYLESSIEDSIKNDLLESTINRINDENERTTPVQGFSIITVNWNPDFKNHLYRGEIELDNIHPKCLIPQPGIFDLDKMDYFYLVYSVSKDFIKKRYGVEVPDYGEEYPEYNNMGEQGDNNNDTDNITVITRWSKDIDGEIGKFTWCNDTTLEDKPKYFKRRQKTCKKCSERVYGKECECGSKKYKEEVEDYETLIEDVVKYDGTIVPRGTRVKYFCPTRYPIIMRKNVPLPFNFGGQSDIDVIRDQADCIKKVISTIEEKVLRGGVIIKAKAGHKVNLSNNLYQVIKGEIDELSVFGAVDLQASIQQDLQFAAEQYKSAKDTLGITDSFQGKPDASARSGVAKQIQVFQTSGRMQSKAFNKRDTFKRLFEVMFEFKLAFYDEIRPYLTVGQNNEPAYGEFSKYDFLEQDASGEWYYNTDFLFSAEAGDGIPKDKMWLMNQTLMYTQQGLLNKVQFWAAMQKFGFPGAGEYKKQAQAELEMQQQMQQQQMQIQQQQMEEMKQKADMQSQIQLMQEQKKAEHDMEMDKQDKEIDIAKLVQEQMKINNQKEQGYNDMELKKHMARTADNKKKGGD